MALNWWILRQNWDSCVQILQLNSNSRHYRHQSTRFSNTFLEIPLFIDYCEIFIYLRVISCYELSASGPPVGSGQSWCTHAHFPNVRPNVFCPRMMLWTLKHNEQIHNHQAARGWHLWLSAPRPQPGVWRARCYKKVSIQEFMTSWIIPRNVFVKAVIVIKIMSY